MLVIKAKRINLIHIFVIVGIGLILTSPAIFYGVFGAQDLVPYHMKWAKHFSEQFWTGDLYPRWLLKMNAGLGSPTFFFYAPIPYYFTSLFHPLFANAPYGWAQLSLSTSLALVASGITAYIWLKNITDRNSALIASILYMALPYHLAVDLYWRFAFAEYWTFVWIPLILYFSKKIVSEQKFSIVGFAVSYALLIMTHLPTLIIFSPVPIGYILLFAGKRQRKKALIRLLVAMILGVGLSAIYWLPAMTTQEYISMNAIRERAYFYGNLFLFSGPGDYHEKIFWRYLEVLTMLMGGLACCAFVITRNNKLGTFRRESNYWIFIAIIALFMTLPISKPVWDLLPVVQIVAFPWRFNTVLTVATTALLALAVSSLNPVIFLNKKPLVVAILLVTSLLLAGLQLLPTQEKIQFPWYDNTVLILGISAFIVLAISSLKQPVNFSNKKPLVVGILLVTSLLLSSGRAMELKLFRPSDVDTNLEISMDALEYRPEWVPPEIFEPGTVSKLGKSSAKASVTVGQGSLLVERWKPREIVLQANATTDIWLTINQFYYPGWTARLNGESQLLPVQPLKPEGLLRVGVPSGKHSVIVTLDAGIEERAGQIISAVSAIIALFLMFWLRKVEQVSVSYDSRII